MAEQPKAAWLDFVDLGPAPGRKTRCWSVRDRGKTYGTGTLMGHVSWYAPWRQYVFSPTQQIATVWERKCLRDLAAFCEWATVEHRAARALEAVCG